MVEKKAAEKLHCPQLTGECKKDIKTILERLGAGAEVFVEINGRLNGLDREFEHIWEWKRKQNSGLEKLSDAVIASDKETTRKLDRFAKEMGNKFETQLEKQKIEIEELVKPVCEAVAVLQTSAATKKGEGIGKNKIAEGILKYGVGGTTLFFALWKLYEILAATGASP